MKQREVDEIIGDIREAFMDVGTIDDTPNVQWLSRLIDEHDELYQQDVNPAYAAPVDIVALVMGGTRKSELEEIGLDYRKVTKLYIASTDFSLNGIEPREEDRLIHKGIKYNVLRIKPTSIADTDLMYTVFVQESPFTAQSEEYREKIEPNFEPDATQSEQDTGTTGDPVAPVSGQTYANKPAEVISAAADDGYEIAADVNDKLKINLNQTTEATITLAEGVWTKEQLVADMQAKLDASFGASQILVSLNDTNHVVMRTTRLGSTAFIEIKVVAGSCYLTLGYKIGVYQGCRNLDYDDDPFYNDSGDPLYNG